MLEVLGAPEVREALSTPSSVPLRDRELLAAMMAADMLHEAIPASEDMPGLIMSSLADSRSWRDARELARERPGMVPEVLRRLLPEVLRSVTGLLEADLSELEEGESDRLAAFLRALLESPDGMAEMTVTPDQRRTLVLLLRMLARALDRSLAPLLERLMKDAETMVSLERLLPGQGWDLHRVDLHRKALEDLERYASLLRDHPDMERLAELLGRRDGERERLSSSNHHSSTETHSLRFSGDLQRMLPQEMVNLADERLKLLFYARMCERRLLTYQLRGRNFSDGVRKRAGPVVALLDSSGSMSGEPELASKALLLSLARGLVEERRPLRVLMFSVDVQSYDLTGGRGSDRFLDFLCCTFGGGTDFDAALRKGIECLQDPDWQGADILFITDGLARIKDRGCLHDWNCLKERQGARIFTVIVGGTEPGGLQRISDQVFLMGRRCDWQCGPLLRDFTPQPRSVGSCWVTQ